jgi:hypothetical protein
MFLRKIIILIVIGSILLLNGCQKNVFQSPTVAPATLRDVPSLRLNYRYEPDVPAPSDDTKKVVNEERNAAIQADFDQNRPQELLDKTLASPDKNKILAVYHRATDVPAEFRLDMYSSDGKLLRKITPDSMAVHFPDTIVWSPDATTLAFVAMVRAGEPGNISPNAAPPNVNANSANTNSANTNTNITNTNTANANAETANTEAGTNANAVTPPPVTTPTAPANVLTFRTEQIYVCNSDGEGLKAVTQNEGLIYFYYVWSPDSQMLASLAATYREWQFLNYQSEQKGEAFNPLGRPRLVEKNGRERRLDDALTQVRPVWSPDSAKVAVGFDKQIRIYDAIGNAPTQAAIPLRNSLLISSQAFDHELQRREAANNANTNANASNSANTNQPPTTLPEESTLVSFNPIVTLEWATDDLLYFQTGYIKRMKNDADSVRSYLRWHRLILSPQAVSLGN